MHWRRGARGQNKSVEWSRFTKFPRISTFSLIYTSNSIYPGASWIFHRWKHLYTRRQFSFLWLPLGPFARLWSLHLSFDSSIFLPTQFGVERCVSGFILTGFPSPSITPQFTMCSSPVPPAPPGHAFHPAAIIRCPRSTSFFRSFVSPTWTTQFEENQNRSFFIRYSKLWVFST